MITKIRVVNIHSKRITLDALQEELRMKPWRLEEKNVGDRDHIFAGSTPLMSSAAFGNLEVVKFLLSVGANIEAKHEV